MTTPNRDTTGSGGTTTGGTAVSSSIELVREHLRNPTDYLNFFRQIVSNAPSGVTQQQLLDTISDSYTSGGELKTGR
jgi:hypothetical protein